MITYNNSNMRLVVHSDAGYSNKTNACNREGTFLTSHGPDPPQNGAVLDIVWVMQAITSSIAEAKIEAAYINTREAINEWKILKELREP